MNKQECQGKVFESHYRTCMESIPQPNPRPAKCSLHKVKYTCIILVQDEKSPKSQIEFVKVSFEYSWKRTPATCSQIIKNYIINLNVKGYRTLSLTLIEINHHC